MIVNIIKFTHSFGSIITNTLPLCFQNPISNNLFILSYTITPITWILCNDECLISFFVKKIKLIQVPNDYSDLVSIFNDIRILNNVFNTNMILQCLSVFVIQKNTPLISPISFYIPMALKIVYVYDIKWDTKFRKIMFPYFQGIMLYSFGSLLYKYFHN
jgi:hypothetical protein